MRQYLSFKDVNARLILTDFSETYALEYVQYIRDAFFPSWSVSMGPWYTFSYMIAMNIDLHGQLSDRFNLWIIIHVYEAEQIMREHYDQLIIDMSIKDCW